MKIFLSNMCNKKQLIKKLSDLVHSGLTVNSAEAAVGVPQAWVHCNAPHLYDVHRKVARKRELRETAATIESWVYFNRSQSDLAEEFGCSEHLVRKRLNRYFEKPKESITLKSKV